MNNNEFQRTENLPFEIDETLQRRKPKNKTVAGKIILVRSLISLGLACLLIFTLAWTYLYTVAHGPSDLMRERFVIQASEKASTKWIPHLVMPADEIDAILERQGE